MNIIQRISQRIVIFAVALFVIWLIVTQVFDRIDQRTPFFIAFALTYIIAAYFILPRVIRITSLILRRGRIPRFTFANDGLPADPVNIIVIGSKKSLIKAFTAAGWNQANPLTMRTAWRMGMAFLKNKPYPEAPFSDLFLFDRKQDIGFQQAIGNSPRKRHHIRFWAKHIEHIPDPLDFAYWTKEDDMDHLEESETENESVSEHELKNKNANSIIWIGAGTKDTGFGLASLTYQISHAVDPHVDEERDHIRATLELTGLVSEVSHYDPGSFKVGKYISDGKIMVLKITDQNQK